MLIFLFTFSLYLFFLVDLRFFLGRTITIIIATADTCQMLYLQDV